MIVKYDLIDFFREMLVRESNSMECLGFLIESVAPKRVFLSTYYQFLNQKLLTPIEYLDIEKKEELVAKCRETGLKFNNERLTDAARVLYTINFINENT